MNHFLRQLIASAILAHAVWGCECHHHGHSAGNEMSASLAKTYDHDAEHKHDSAPENSDKCGHCDCQWLAGDSYSMPSMVNLQHWIEATDGVKSSLSFASDECCFDRTTDHALILTLGVRAHLAFCVQLV